MIKNNIKLPTLKEIETDLFRTASTKLFRRVHPALNRARSNNR